GALELQKSQFAAAGQQAPELRPAATVLLAGDFQSQAPRRGLFGRLFARLLGGAAPAGADTLPNSIPIDAPVDLQSRNGFRADLHEATLFGEMSCLNRSP